MTLRPDSGDASDSDQRQGHQYIGTAGTVVLSERGPRLRKRRAPSSEFEVFAGVPKLPQIGTRLGHPAPIVICRTKKKDAITSVFLVRLEGFEPSALRSGGARSIP